MRTIEALIEPDGTVTLLEQVSFPERRRAMVTVLDEATDEAPVNAMARLSEAALSDWNREEEDAAWAHFQPAR